MAEWNRNTLWRQGHQLDKETIDALRQHYELIPEQALLIVASHDCDITQKPNVEPTIEVVVGRQLEKSDGNYTHAKNSRKLHVEFEGVATFWAEFDATTKLLIDKSVLNDFIPCPETQMSPENHAIFQMWLASRYRRSAFPDEFESRLTSKEFKLHEKISKAVKPHGELIVGVFFDVDEGVEVTRNGPDDTYILDITIMHLADDEFVAAEKAANTAVKAIEQAFKDKLYDSANNRWKYIELRFCESVSESVLTYQQFKMLKRWRLEHISLAADPEQPVLAE